MILWTRIVKSSFNDPFDYFSPPVMIYRWTIPMLKDMDPKLQMVKRCENLVHEEHFFHISFPEDSVPQAVALQF